MKGSSSGSSGSSGSSSSSGSRRITVLQTCSHDGCDNKLPTNVNTRGRCMSHCTDVIAFIECMRGKVGYNGSWTVYDTHPCAWKFYHAHEDSGFKICGTKKLANGVSGNIYKFA